MRKKTFKKNSSNIQTVYFLKKLAILSIGLSLISPILQPLTANALSSGDLQIKVQDSPKIDIALTVGNTQLSTTTLEGDIIKELKSRGIEENRIEFQATDTTSVSSDDTDARQIFNEWDNFPYNGPPYWYYDETNNWVTTDYNVAYETGFIDKSNGLVQNFTLDTTVQGPQQNQPLGFVFRATPNKDNPDYWDMYYLWVSYDSETKEKALAIFKVKNQNLNFSTRNSPSHYSATPLRRYQGDKFGWPNHTPYDYGGFPHGTPAEPGITVKNLKDSKTETQILDVADISGYASSDWYNLKLEVKGNTFVASLDGVKLMEYEDVENPYEKGYYGIFSYSHVKPKFRSISSNIETYKSFTEVIRQQEWRDDSQRFIINLDDYKREQFENEQESGEIAMRLINDNIDYIGVGTNLNETQNENVVKQINGEGTHISSDNDYSLVIKEIADYIEEELNELRQSSNNSQYVLAGQELEMSVTPESYQKNTQNTKYPNGRWKLDHDENYYHNSLGRFAKSGLFQSDLDFTLTQPGKYEIWFEDIHPSPRYIYVHRKPIANFSLSVKESENNFLISTEDLSYDLDLQYQADRGIAEREWKWRETTASTWTTGEIPGTLPKGKSYIVQLRVKDYQNQWSEPESRYITTDSMPTEPIASFDVSRTAFIDDDVKVNSTPYDPSGEEIVEEEWTYKKGGKEVYKGSSFVRDFGEYGVGEYKVQLRVKNKSGLWSVPFERTIEILPELVGEIKVTPTPSGWTNGNVQLSVETKNISKILLPNGTFVTGSNTTYTATENGEYSFVGYNAKNEIETMTTHVVGNIDRSGKKAAVNPNDGNWKNKDIKVEIIPINEIKK